MRSLTTIPARHARRARPTGRPQPRPVRARFAIPDPPDRTVPGESRAFTPLIDAKAAGQLLGVPHTWLLAQARERRIPHHRLGHYVRFNPEDLQYWLKETRSMPYESRLRPPRGRV